MTAEDVERLIHNSPCQPYRLILDDGEQILVWRPRKSHVSGNYISLVGECRPPDGEATIDRFRIVPIARVITAECISRDPRRK